MVRVHGAALRAGFIAGLPRFARNDGMRGSVGDFSGGALFSATGL